MTLDSDPNTRRWLNGQVQDMDQIRSTALSKVPFNLNKVNTHTCDNFRDAIDTVNRFKIDVIIINISSINIETYKEDCIQLRAIYSFAPIIAVSDTATSYNLDNYNYIGFDDILEIGIITSKILLRVLHSAIQRSKNYHLFHTNNQKSLISNQLLKLLLDKQSLLNVARSAIEIIHTQNANLQGSSASIFTIVGNDITRIVHTGAEEDKSSLEGYKKKIRSLQPSYTENSEFNYFKKVINEEKNTVRVSIPLRKDNIIFALLKIDTEAGLVHPTEERRFYKVLSETLSDVLSLAQERERFEQVHLQNNRLINEMSSAAIGIDKHDLVTHWNHQAEKYFDIQKENAMNKRLFDLEITCDWPLIISRLYDSLNSKVTSERFEVSYKRVEDEHDRILSIAITPFVEPNGLYSGYLLLMDDITEKKHMEKKHQQSMYLESIGQLAAGIAHEINTPMQYIGDNLDFLKTSFNDAASAINEIKEKVMENTLDKTRLDNILEEADFEYLSEELPLAFSQTTEGVGRVCSIVKAMKEFSHPNSEEKVLTDINKSIDSTITISKHTWKYHSDMEVKLDPELPQVMCHPGPFNEVILNIIVNAADVIKEKLEKSKSHDKGKITVQTVKKADFAEIRISDTGGGIPIAIQEKIFDPFFTTKEVGKGTGQGLALSYSIIKERHNGDLFFETVAGESTTFIIQIPYK